MKIAFIVNQLMKETAAYTTTGLALQAHKMGHEVYYMGVGDLAYFSDEQMGGLARKAPSKQFRSPETFLQAIKETEKSQIKASDLDVVLLRNDPSADIDKRPWAQNAGIVFGQLAQKQGVVVLNDPTSLSQASNKMYFQYFPKEVRPETIITRNVADIEAFYKANGGKIILKPLQGSGGRNVFLINKQEVKNLNQIVEAICRDGFVVAQEYLPAAKNGDIRLFLLDGEPIVVEGHYAAIHRQQKEGEIRSNIHQGGKAGTARMTKRIKEIVELVGPKLKEDGMFLTGLDIVGNKLMEVNVFSPGGLVHACELYDVDFYSPVIKAIENKIDENRL
ncbi:glutathione synthetase [Olivibacter sp. XZL3]|uniref:glutathione synthetase n=1 Tax=Olivibacter sp. XZL3 TaxID=1735116 RepID=UPI0010654CA8|nr:glutathione synthetase [Olivibacter sp. XZL3]